MTREDLNLLLQKLPTNYCKILSERTEFSTNYIWQVLRSKRTNSKILDEAIILANEHQGSLTLFKEKIHKLHSKSNS